MTSPQPTRRTFLKRSSAALLTVGTVATSGCTESLPPLGSRVRYGRVDVPDTATDPVYRRWLPAASALPTDDLDPGYVNYVMPGYLGQTVVGTTNKDPHFFQKPYLDYFGIGYDNYDRVIGLHRTTKSTYVLEGDIDPDTVSNTLVESGFSSAGTYAGYDLFDRADGPRTTAVSQSAIVWAHHEQSTAIVKAVIDAERGAVDRHHETDEAFARATDAVGASPWTLIGGISIDPTGDALVRSMSYTANQNAVYYTYHSLYPTGTSVSEQSFQDALNKHRRATNGRAVDVQINDQMATVEMRLPPSAIQTDYADATVPQITWGVVRDDEGLTIRHEAGETTPADTLTFYVESGGEESVAETQFSDAVEQIQPGDSITIDDPSTAEATRIVGEFSPADSDRSCRFVVSTLP